MISKKKEKREGIVLRAEQLNINESKDESINFASELDKTGTPMNNKANMSNQFEMAKMIGTEKG